MYDPGADNPNSFEDEEVISAAQQAHTRRIIPQDGQRIDWDSTVIVTVLNAGAPGADDLNHTSIVLRISFGRTAFMLMGDAEKEDEQEICREYHGQLRCDLIKIGHHGSQTSTTAELLQEARPANAVIFCGRGNQYGHPAPRTIQALRGAGVRINRTDEDGTITAMSDGSKLTVNSRESPASRRNVASPLTSDSTTAVAAREPPLSRQGTNTQAIPNDSMLAVALETTARSQREEEEAAAWEPNDNQSPDAFSRWLKLFFAGVLLLAYLASAWGVSQLPQRRDRLIGASALGIVATLVFSRFTAPDMQVAPPNIAEPVEDNASAQMPQETHETITPATTTIVNREGHSQDSATAERPVASPRTNQAAIIVEQGPNGEIQMRGNPNAVRPRPANPYPVTTTYTTTTTIYPTSRPQQSSSADVIPTPTDVKPRSGSHSPEHQTRIVNINTADTEELKHISGVSDHYAPIIYEERRLHGPFLDVEDVNRRVGGLGRHVDWTRVRF